MTPDVILEAASSIRRVNAPDDEHLYQVTPLFIKSYDHALRMSQMVSAADSVSRTQAGQQIKNALFSVSLWTKETTDNSGGRCPLAPMSARSRQREYDSHLFEAQGQIALHCNELLHQALR